MMNGLTPSVCRGVAGVVVLGAAVLIGGCQDTVSDKSITRVGVGDVQRMSKEKPEKVLLLDPRPPDRFAAGHLPGAVNVPLDRIPAERGGLPSALASPKFVVVYGDNPGDGYAIAATKRLLRAGQGGARLFTGGLSEWRGSGLSVDSAVSPGEADEAGVQGAAPAR